MPYKNKEDMNRYMRDYREQQRNKTLAMIQDFKELLNTTRNIKPLTLLREDASSQEIAEAYKKLFETYQNLQYLQIAMKGFQVKYGLTPTDTESIALSGSHKPSRLHEEKEHITK